MLSFQRMKNTKIILLLTLLAIVSTSYAMREWEFINPQDLEIRIVPESREIIAGETATFTIQIRNKSDKTVQIPFKTGQRWDFAVYHMQTQIFRWSQGMRWMESPHSIPVRAGQTEVSPPFNWHSIDRNGKPLPQGKYRLTGMVMTGPRHLVSNTTEITLLPPVVKPEEVIQAGIFRHFELKLPRSIDGREVYWFIRYLHNDNRIKVVESRKDDKNVTIVFLPQRRGHVIMHLFAQPEYKIASEMVERRTYRVEVIDNDGEASENNK